MPFELVQCNLQITRLFNRWIEVSYLLRQPIKCEEDMLYAAASAEAGIMFTDQVSVETLDILAALIIP